MQRKESRVWSISAIFASLLPMNHLKIELGSWIDWQRDWSIDASARRSSHHLTVQLPPNYWKGTVWNQILLNNYNDAMATYKVNWVYNELSYLRLTFNVDMFHFLSISKSVCLCIIDYAGLSTDPKDVYTMLK
jgi:hypothetical protein